ncbi:unnamed protein product [Rhodiola kirilowii]
MAETAMCVIGTNLSPEDERVAIRDIVTSAEADTKEGDTFYLITHRWWQSWLKYVNQEHPVMTSNGPLNNEGHDLSNSSELLRPSSIDNSDLMLDSALEDSNTEMGIRNSLVEGRDYILLPHGVWNQLYLWYGGGPVVARKVIKSGLSQTELSVEVYPLLLQLLVMPRGDQSTIRISKKETIGELHRRACETFDLNPEQVWIWDYYGHKKHALMNDMGKTLDDANIQTDQEILLEIRSSGRDALSNGYGNVVYANGNDSASVLLEPSKSGLSIAGGLSASKGVSGSGSSELSQNQILTSPAGDVETCGVSGVITRGASAGLSGLQNLGNTCFMNSAIQCLVHTPEFARYFREDYHQEINWQNPFGMVGELALAFGELVRKLWAPGRAPVAPRAFKQKLARFAPQFSGYNQHDSQELLAFLLDGLHEDLNRVKHKPYVKSKDANGRPDEEVADEYWANHIARNDSIIVDVCQGQYKSTLVCPVCNKVSVTFDPFMYLSLPLQSTNTRTMTVTVFSCDGTSLPNACTVTVPKQGRCRDLVLALHSACSIKQSEKLLLAEVRGNLIHRLFNDPLTSLSMIKDDDYLAAYKIPDLGKKTIILQLVHRHRCEEQGGKTQAKPNWKPYGIPLVWPISCEDVITRGDLQSIVHTMLSPLLRVKEPGSSNHTVGASDSSSDIGSNEAGTDSTPSLSKESHNSTKLVPQELHLQMVDENNVCIDISTGGDKVVKLSSSMDSILVFIDWTDNQLENYDTHYLESLPEVLKPGPATKKARSEPLSLYTCLEAFLREEPLVTDDMWYCPDCKEQRQASKKLDLWRLPDVLVIHLKRFSYSRSTKHKLETFVNFPVHDFDLTNYVAYKNSPHKQLYELYALTNHYGGMGSGHYTAHIKLLDENRWYNFDDNHVTPINEEDVKTAASYVLFYRRVKTDNTSSNAAQSSEDHNVSPKV